MDLVQVIGWVGVVLTMVAYFQRTMLPLRIAAATANACFVVWSIYIGINQTIVLNAVLLLINIYRIGEVFLLMRRVRTAREEGDFSLDLIRPLLKSRNLGDGSYVFRKGDRPDKLYYLISGEVSFDEIDKRVGPGDVFGEIAFFIRRKERTASARCVGDCEFLALDESDFTRLFLQNPAFNMHVVRAIAERLAGGQAGGQAGGGETPVSHAPALPIATAAGGAAGIAPG